MPKSIKPGNKTSKEKGNLGSADHQSEKNKSEINSNVVQEENMNINTVIECLNFTIMI
jgi:hypothetical protein